VRYVLLKWNGSAWVIWANSRDFSGVIGTYQESVTMPSWSVLPNGGPKGYWRMVYLISWANGTETVNYGGRIVVPSRYGDQYCTHPYMRCQDNADFIYVHQMPVL
jgi:hypothetical protein